MTASTSATPSACWTGRAPVDARDLLGGGRHGVRVGCRHDHGRVARCPPGTTGRAARSRRWPRASGGTGRRAQARSSIAAMPAAMTARPTSGHADEAARVRGRPRRRPGARASRPSARAAGPDVGHLGPEDPAAEEHEGGRQHDAGRRWRRRRRRQRTRARGRGWSGRARAAGVSRPRTTVVGAREHGLGRAAQGERHRLAAVGSWLRSSSR